MRKPRTVRYTLLSLDGSAPWPDSLAVRITTVFDVSVPLDRVVAYLGDPRHLITANHKGPVIEQSDGPLASGSWYVLGFDQLRARVEYTVYDPPRRIAASVSMTGRGAGGSSAAQEFVLSELDEGAATRVEASIDGEGGWIHWAPLVRIGQSMTWRRMRAQIDASA
jgi:carbon monoxide dehydrogenase subunit G